MTPEELQIVFQKWGEDTVKAIQTALVNNKSIATRTLHDSIAFTTGEDFIEFTMEEYGHYVDLGTRPHWAPIAPFKTWARLKGLPPNAAFAVRASIAKKGTKPHRFFDQVIQREISKLLPLLDGGFTEYLDNRVQILNEQNNT